MRESEGVFCGGQCPFCFGLYLGKEEVAGSSPAISSTQKSQLETGLFVCHYIPDSEQSLIVVPHYEAYRINIVFYLIQDKANYYKTCAEIICLRRLISI